MTSSSSLSVINDSQKRHGQGQVLNFTNVGKLFLLCMFKSANNSYLLVQASNSSTYLEEILQSHTGASCP